MNTTSEISVNNFPPVGVRPFGNPFFANWRKFGLHTDYVQESQATNSHALFRSLIRYVNKFLKEEKPHADDH